METNTSINGASIPTPYTQAGYGVREVRRPENSNDSSVHTTSSVIFQSPPASPQKSPSLHRRQITEEKIAEARPSRISPERTITYQQDSDTHSSKISRFKFYLMIAVGSVATFIGANLIERNRYYPIDYNPNTDAIMHLALYVLKYSGVAIFGAAALMRSGINLNSFLLTQIFYLSHEVIALNTRIFHADIIITLRKP